MFYESFLLDLYQYEEKIKAEHKTLVQFKPVKAFRRRFRNYVQERCKSDLAILDNLKIHVSPSEYVKLLITDYRGLKTKYFKNNIKENNIVVDVGANIGYYTCLFSKLVGKNGHVYSFEPDPTNYKLLKQNVEENNCRNVTLEQKAVTDKTGTSSLNLSTNSSTSHSLYETFENSKTIQINTVGFDDYFHNVENIDFIKSNAQGGDYPMILGMPNLLNRSKKIGIWLEFSPFLIRQQGSNPAEFLKLLNDLKFRIDLVKFTYDKPKKVKYEQIIKFAEEFNGIGLLCTRNLSS